MDRYIEKAFKKRFEHVEHHPTEHSHEGSKSAVSLALKEYSRTKESEDFSTARFLRFAIPQICVFLFAGHDTTTSIMVYTYHVLSKRADILNRLREEHAAVLGDDMELKCLREKPSLLDQLPYTTAVIKETMRMYPPAGTMREGLPSAFLTDRNGRRYPTEGCQATVFHIALHHNPRVWTRAMEYLPERWLVGPGDPLYPPDSGFRGFELGPRNCIGQDLAQLEIRLVLVMTVRQFNITPAYEKWDGMRGRGWLSGLAALLGIGGKETRHSVNGERAYPVEKGGCPSCTRLPLRGSLC